MRQSFILLLTIAFGLGLQAQQYPDDPYFGESCTSIMAGKKATTDGSVITAHTCDGNYRTWLTMEKAQDHSDSSTAIIRKGTLRTETPWDLRDVSIAGSIPQVAHTYAFLNTAYPCLNEKQLAIGETTFVGADTLVNNKGMFLVEELERIALERCDNARSAIQLIGDLIKTYGYADWGECLTIADRNEVWQMEILGEGPARIGGVWAAQRIPDDHVGISANISRIGKIDRKNKDYFMASDNVENVAKELGLWNGEGDFIFWKAFGHREKPYDIREFHVLSTLAPELNLSMDMTEMPFSVKPEQKVSVQKITELYRATYEGTQYDMTRKVKYIVKKYDEKRNPIGEDTIVSPTANPWITRDEMNTLNFLAPGTIDFKRNVSVAWSSYGQIIQLRGWLPDEVGGVAWFSFDNPGESPRIPIYAGSTSLPDGFELCGQKRYREDAALWSYRKANKLATVSWGKTRGVILENVLSFEEKALKEMPDIEKEATNLIKDGKTEEAKLLLSNFTKDFEAATSQRWKELEIKFWELFGKGF
jgi:dipeptidase